MALSFETVTLDQLPALDAVLGPALHFPGGTMLEWMRDMIGVAGMRAVRQDGRIVAGIGAIPFGQWYGGRLVPAAGMTAVGVAPDARGAGVGAFMLRESLADLRAAGLPLAVLYPATLSYYRGAGYERAGTRITYELPLALIQLRSPERGLTIEPFQLDDPRVRAAYAERARRASGNLERPEWLWQIRLAPKDKIVYRFLVRRGDTIEGYIAYTQAGRADPIIVTDAVILSREAGRAMLGLLAGYQSVIDQMVWTGSVLDPFVYLLDENLTAGTKSRVGMRTSYDWMLRIVDVAGALVARGYPMRISAELEIQVVDPILPANDGVYRLRVADGRAAVLPGGSGRITIGIRELAALYTGFQSPSELRALGLIDGPDADLALLGAIFSGPQPWLADMF